MTEDTLGSRTKEFRDAIAWQRRHDACSGEHDHTQGDDHEQGSRGLDIRRNETHLMSVASTHREPNRWAVLALLSVAQLMVVLDATIVTIAIPSAQNALHFSTDSRQWIITAYALAFGSLLLLGGKLGDLFGRKWSLIAGLVGFAVASAIGGMAQSFGMLVGARA